MRLPATLPILLLTAAVAACDQPKARGPGAEGTAQQLAHLITGRAAPAAPAPELAAPTWAAGLIGQPVTQAFPTGGACLGNTDVSWTEAGATRVAGWAWDVAAHARVQHVVLADAAGRIIGAGEGGVARSDVPAARPEVTDGATGWTARLGPARGRLSAFGITREGRACPLGAVVAKAGR